MRPLSRCDFEIAIICALSPGVNAIETLFDEHYDDLDHLYEKQDGDLNIYKTGRIGRHYVVLVYMPGKGNRRSASVSSGLRISFTGIRLALVVGICGGIPYSSEGDEIILGDVIISDSIVEYDVGRQYIHKFERERSVKEVLGPPNREIRTFLRRLETRRTRLQIQEKLMQGLSYLQQHDKDDWQYPGVSKDILFDASYIHNHIQYPTEQPHTNCCTQASSFSCQDIGCSGQLIQRCRLKDTEQPEPRIHIGTIGSANSMMKFGEMRDQLSRSEGIVCFEMEGAGVWDNLPCVVVKGVSNYADGHVNKMWQSYAAAAAASCTKAFLEYWPTTANENRTIYRPYSPLIIPVDRDGMFTHQNERVTFEVTKQKIIETTTKYTIGDTTKNYEKDVIPLQHQRLEVAPSTVLEDGKIEENK
ncbi:nucleoside phosphorylase domain-containing protein [Talaromyces proteolyticus]|uniref:Nucleoside phosphorylase domain-containing protein n=1 Tax=Talaromyces proteolyticus TaxID=1131652 RepID=A0AAD4KEV1_9EURO|nr:nucleoside phosphorylase domain-containing protein [Talaromyces proteolyticus]KAH8690644.1 nucleoside phosphorylase domain-containing protein [Talaromyces proteolyticus]